MQPGMEPKHDHHQHGATIIAVILALAIAMFMPSDNEFMRRIFKRQTRTLNSAQSNSRRKKKKQRPASTSETEQSNNPEDRPLTELAPKPDMQPTPASLHTELQSAPGQELTPTTLQKGSDRPCATDEFNWRERERTRKSQQEARIKRLREQREIARQAMDTRIRELDPESLPFPPFIPFPPDLWNEPLRGKHQETYRMLRDIWHQNAKALSRNHAERSENTNDDRNQDQNRISRQQSQRQRQEPSQNQTPDESAEPTAQRLAPEIEKRQVEAAMKPWILLLTTCTANLALGNMEHSISVIINICAVMPWLV